MEDTPDHILDEFIETCQEAGSRGLMRCSGGNFSQRLDPARFLVTSSGSWMERLSAEEVSLCRIDDGAVLDGPIPTIEIGFHAGILRIRPDVNAVMHFQSPCATALACQETDNAHYFVIPEIPFYMGHVARVPYLHPGSKELSEAVTAAMRDHDMVIMSNHGLVTAATDGINAIRNAEFFELACHIIIHNGNMLKPMPKEDVERLLELRRENQFKV
jgi:ribulose-5-phosphate 4-epimerase/fuculose-1-phosphate aldolase